MIGRLCCHDRFAYAGCMATTVNRSLAECAQRVDDRSALLTQLEETEAYYRSQVSPEDPDGTMACAFEARRLRRIRTALTH